MQKTPVQKACDQLQEGANQLEKECNQVQEGANPLQKACDQLQEGANQLQEELVMCLCTSSGGSSTSNLHETHQHRDSKVCRVLLLSFGVVHAQRTSANLHEPHHHRASKVCRVLLH